MSDKVVAVVQARMGSTRLPNKAMLWLNGYPVIEWVIRRLRRCERLDDIIVAIPHAGISRENSVLGEYVARRGVEATGTINENNVLNRILVAAEVKQADYVVRVCGDCPFVSPSVVDDLVERFMEIEVDYMYNHIPRSNLYPDGLGAEIVSFETLELLHQRAKGSEQIEHAFNHI